MMMDQFERVGAGIFHSYGERLNVAAGQFAAQLEKNRKGIRQSSYQSIKSISLLLNIDGAAIASAMETSYRNILEDIVDMDSLSGVVFVEDQLEMKARSRFGLCLDDLAGDIRIENCENFVVFMTGREMKAFSSRKYALRIINCRNFIIYNVRMTSKQSGIYIDTCCNFIINDNKIADCQGYGITLFRSSQFIVEKSIFTGNLASGLTCIGQTHDAILVANVFSKSSGGFNWDAGLHLNHVTPLVKGEDFFPDRCHEAKRIDEKCHKPNLIHVVGNVFDNNHAQGIYSEGAIMCSFIGNVLKDNNKEAFCLDWGSSLNIVCDNVFTGNGLRMIRNEAELEADFIKNYPVLEDGSSSMKLPALSLDNAASNLVSSNIFSGNYGGGIKMVRASIYNDIRGNLFSSNAGDKVNDVVKYFHTVTILAMGNKNSEFSDDSDLLDLLSSDNNNIIGNNIIASGEWHGIYIAEYCKHNVYQENIILKTNGSPVAASLE